MNINLFYNNYDKINEVFRNISIKLLRNKSTTLI